MISKRLEKVDEELQLLRKRIEFGGPQALIFCETLENVLRELKVFDQKKYRAEQLENDINRRFEAIITALEKITEILKDNNFI
ncbi:MAG: hypothetical protein J7K72_00695 [Candidatus Aenigmarchaeota archaeon]|nr:hypothetical protein [Candidatus Aenigmarchaeota archaeon]